MTEGAGLFTIWPSTAYMEEHGKPDFTTSVGLVLPNRKCAVSYCLFTPISTLLIFFADQGFGLWEISSSIRTR